jgi:hypothetical protein
MEADRVGEEVLCRASRRWFEQGAPLLGGDLWHRLVQRPVPPGEVEFRWDGVAGEVWAECAVDYALMSGVEWWCYTAQGWQDLLAAAGGRSLIAAFTVYDLAEVVAGWRHPGFPRLSLSGRYVDLRSREWWGLKAQVSPQLVFDRAEREQRLLAFVREMAELCGPSSGEISFDNASHVDFATSIEHNLDLYPWHNVRESKRRLRGYSWLTIVAKRIGDRLGGVDALRASGAFAQVDRLGNGSYWLQATEYFADYDMDRAQRVQQVLQPVLPAGTPRADRSGESPHLLALSNARPGRRGPGRNRDEIFKNHIDPRYSSAHRTAVPLRMAALKDRYPHALIWGVIDGEAGAHLICWGAEPGQVWVWQLMPEDDPYAGMDIVRAPGEGLEEVATDPLSVGMRVGVGPAFADLGMPKEQTAADPLVLGSWVSVYDGVPGLQLYSSAEDGQDPEPHIQDMLARAHDFNREVTNARAKLIDRRRT